MSEPTNIYVGNLPYSVRADELRQQFEPFGNVLSAEVIIDRRSRRSRGYGFVEMANPAEAQKAIASLNGATFQGRELRVDESKPKSEKQLDERPTDDETSPRPATVDTSEGEASGVVGFIKRLFG